MEVNQILPNMAPGDAISNHALELKQLLKDWGYQSEIYAQAREGAIIQHCRPIEEYNPNTKNALTLYHYSIGCREVSDLFLKTKGKKLLVYHNITPHQYFEKYSPLLHDLLKKGRDALGDFKDVVDYAIGDSGFNVNELLDLGYKKAEALPILLDFEKFERTAPDPKMMKYLGKGWTTFLFTGRVVPNKAPHDVIRTYARYCHEIDPYSRLILVGTIPFGMYAQELYDLAKSLKVSDHVFLTGHVKFAELIAFYKTADVFLCMSDHEGFCVPLMEAIHFDVPIVAYSSTGVPFTLGDAGILLNKKDEKVAAELAYLVAKDPEVRQKVIEKQRKRVAEFKPEILKNKYRDLIERVVGRS